MVMYEKVVVLVVFVCIKVCIVVRYRYMFLHHRPSRYHHNADIRFESL